MADVRGGDRPGVPRRALHGDEDVLLVRERVRRPTQHPDLPGVSRASGDAPGPEPRGDRPDHQDRPRARRRDRAALAVPPEELLLSGYAEELPDQPVRPADLRRRPSRHRARRRHRAADRHHARPHGGGHRQVDPRRRLRPDPRRDLRDARFQSRRGAARRVCQRAGYPQRRGGRRLPPRAARDPGVPRRLRRQDGGGVAAVRRERIAATDRHRGVRHEGRDQEHELDPVARAGRHLRDRTAGRGARRR